MVGNLAKGTVPYYRAKGRAKFDPLEHNIRAEDAEAQVIALLSSIRVVNHHIPAPDEWLLALLAVPHIGFIYPHLTTNKARQTFLQLIFLKHGLHVNQAGRVRAVYLRPGFERID